MTNQKVVGIIKREKLCVEKADSCDRNCAKCDLVMESSDIIQAYDKVIETFEKIEKYKWHDLRKNPDDLPKNDGWYYCWLRNDTIDYGMDLYFYIKNKKFIDNRRKDVFNVYKVMAFCGFPEGYKQIYTDDTVDRTSEVIAWRLVESFEEGDEK